ARPQHRVSPSRVGSEPRTGKRRWRGIGVGAVPKAMGGPGRGLGLAGCQGRRGIGVGRVPSMWFGKVPEYKLAFCQFSVSAHPPPPPHSPQWKTRGRENFFSQIRARGRAGPSFFGGRGWGKRAGPGSGWGTTPEGECGRWPD
ncbi:hypothetical protein EG860_16160, partial [Enterococcus faecalis]